MLVYHSVIIFKKVYTYLRAKIGIRLLELRVWWRTVVWVSVSF